MSDVVTFPPPPASKTPTLKEKFGYADAAWLKMCAEWRAARAQMQKNWAEYDLAIGWGTLPHDFVKLDTSPLDRIKELEYFLAQAKPQTALLARELLRIAVTILAYQGEDPDPETYFGNGPVLEIARNVLAALEHCEAEMRVGPKHQS
jgi:hypothetical protein